MQTDLSGKVVVISGAARGIGAATARAFSREAAWVVIVDRDVQAGKMLERTIGKAQFIEADLTSEAACENVIQATLKQF